jgi:hypothetical protein
MSQLSRHYDEACTVIPEDRIIGVFYQGSGNYGLDYAGSDVDTKCIVAPSLKELTFGEKMSETYVRENDEHIDFKDIRIMMDIFKKCNLNFLEILYSKYYIINPYYEDLWAKIVECRDEIISNGGDAMLKSMIGIAREKYHAMEHRYPSRMEWINKYGYDPKQLHHLFRLKEFMHRWRNGEPFARCLISVEPDWLIDVKKGHYSLEDARRYGKGTIDFMEEMYREMKTDKPANEEYYKKFDPTILAIVTRSVSREIALWGNK